MTEDNMVLFDITYSFFKLNSRCTLILICRGPWIHNYRLDHGDLHRCHLHRCGQRVLQQEEREETRGGPCGDSTAARGRESSGSLEVIH